MNQDNIKAIYNGNLETLNKEMSDPNNIYLYSINDLMHAKHNEDFRISLVPLVLKGEAEHSGHFLKYKALIDLIAQKKGKSYVIFGWKNPSFSKYTKEDSRITLTNLALPVSKEMSNYLHHLEVRENESRKQTDSLLKKIDETAKSSNSEIRKAVQITKRQIVKNYRRLNSKSNER